MKYTYIPDIFSMVMYFGLLYFVLVLLLFLLNRYVNDKKSLNPMNKAMMYFSIGYALLLFILFFVRGVMAGFYHDENGTAPSDMEKMFNYFHIGYSLIPLIFAYIFDKQE